MIEKILIQLRLWSFLILPLSGYLLGQCFKFFLRIREPSEFGALVVHIVTASLMFLIIADLFSDDTNIKNKHDRILFISITYLFILGVNLGLIKGFI